MKLVDCRKKAKLSREKAAHKLDISTSTLGRWEKGSARVPADILPKIQEVFGISESEIIQLCQTLKLREGA